MPTKTGRVGGIASFSRRLRDMCDLLAAELGDVDQSDVIGVGRLRGVGQKLVADRHPAAAAACGDQFEFLQALQVTAHLRLAPTREVAQLAARARNTGNVCFVQAISRNSCNSGYDPGMPAGRPTLSARCDFGARLFEMRQRKGFSQKQMADALGITQQSYALWERRPVALKPEQITQLVGILGCNVEDILGIPKRLLQRGGPVGKVRQMFEQVSKLPRARQRKILEVVEALVDKAGRAGAAV